MRVQALKFAEDRRVTGKNLHQLDSRQLFSALWRRDPHFRTEYLHKKYDLYRELLATEDVLLLDLRRRRSAR